MFQIQQPNHIIFGKYAASEYSYPNDCLIITSKGAKSRGWIDYIKGNNFKIGDLFYAIPYHICPTVAKYSKAYAVIGGEIDSFWKIEAQNY